MTDPGERHHRHHQQSRTDDEHEGERRRLDLQPRSGDTTDDPTSDCQHPRESDCPDSDRQPGERRDVTSDR